MASADPSLRRLDRSFEQRVVHDAGGNCPQQRCEPEEPSLLEGPSADEERRARTARGIRGVGHRDTDQVNQRKGQADGQPSETDWRTLVRGAKMTIRK